MAHAMVQQWSLTNNMSIEVVSRGIRANAGDPTTAEALLVLAEAQIQWQGTSQQLSVTDLNWADDVWGMTHEHLDFAINLGAERGATVKQQTIPNFQLLAGASELLDPLNAGLAAYEKLFCSLQELLPNRLAAIQKPLEA